jgi:PBP1b-binding outer membrane lipoprotein LpoB
MTRKSFALYSLSLLCLIILVGCASVDITKTAKGYYEPTNPNDVEILFTKPTRSYIELGSITATKHKPGDTAVMHNSLRAKSAPLGADAVIILNQGFDPYNRLWVTGVVIRYTDHN